MLKVLADCSLIIWVISCLSTLFLHYSQVKILRFLVRVEIIIIVHS